MSTTSAITIGAGFVAFAGTVIVLAAAALATFRAGDTRRAWWITAAALTPTED